MKKVLLSITALALVAGSMTFTSCKKGENDPGISFKSRKGRVAGEWTVASYEATSTNSSTSGGTTTTSSSTEMYDGTTYTTTTTTAGTPSDPYRETYTTWSMTFEKDGTYKVEKNYTYTDSQDFGGITFTTTTVTTSTEEGHWSFVGKDKAGEYKNKERIVLNSTSMNETETTTTSGGGSSSTSTTTTNWTAANGEASSIWDLDMLKGKEMVAMMTWNNTYSQTVSSGGSSSTSSSSSNGSGTITLNQ